MANAITYKYSCNELCWDPGGTNIPHDLVRPADEDPSGSWNASVESCLLGVFDKGGRDNDASVTSLRHSELLLFEFVSVHRDRNYRMLACSWTRATRFIR